MRHFANMLCIGLTVFLATASFAQPDNKKNKETGDTTSVLAGPCVHIRNPRQCVNYPTGECFWDYADQRCENYSNSEDRCSFIRSPRQCINSHYNCFWDYDDQRCERRF